MWTAKFWKDTAERVVSTFAQALIGSGLVLTFTDANAYIAAGVAAGVSLVKALAASQVGDPQSASLVKA